MTPPTELVTMLMAEVNPVRHAASYRSTITTAPSRAVAGSSLTKSGQMRDDQSHKADLAHKGNDNAHHDGADRE